MYKHIQPCNFNHYVRKIRSFFYKKKFIEIHATGIQNIIGSNQYIDKKLTYKDFNNNFWPLFQNNDILLEDILLNNKNIDGCFTISTTYELNKNQIEIKPLFEFAGKGDINNLLNIQKSLLQYIGFEKNKYIRNPVTQQYENNIYNDFPELMDPLQFYHTLLPNISNKTKTQVLTDTFNVQKIFPENDYKNIAAELNTQIIDTQHNKIISKKNGTVFILKNFPLSSNPHWNIKIENNIAKKTTIILNGEETIDSGELSCNADDMRQMFSIVSKRNYSKKLYNLFGKERVDRELNDYLAHDFFPRYSGRINICRLISGIIKDRNVL